MRGITLNRLRVFLMVVRTGQVSMAARSLGISQPSVSQQIRRLQDHFGLEMLASERGRLVPTERAMEVVELAERIDRAVRHIEEISRRATRGSRRVLRVGTTASSGMYFVPGILRQLQSRHPDLQVSLFIAEADEIREELAAGLLDVAAGPGDLESEDMTSVELFRMKLHAIVGPSRTSLTRTELERQRVAITRDLHSLVVVQLQSAGIHVSANQYNLYDEVEGVKKAVEAGLGVGFTFATAIEREVEHRYLNRVEIDGLDIGIPFKLVYPTIQASDEMIQDITYLAHTQLSLRERSRGGLAPAVLGR